MADKFSVLLDHRDSKTKVITCQEKGLNIKAYPRKEGNLKVTEEGLVLTALFFFRNAQGAIVKEQCSYIDFVISNVGSPCSEQWTSELFYNAIDFYCNSYLKLAHDGIQRVAHQQWYAFDRCGFDDDFECLNPGNVQHAPLSALEDLTARQTLKQAGENNYIDAHPQESNHADPNF